MKTALEVLFREGHVPYFHHTKARILSQPFQFVKAKVANKKRAWEILDTHEVLTFPQEGFRTIYATGPLDSRELPRIIWVQIDPGLWGGWARTRQRQKAYKDYREWQKTTPGAPILQGKTA